MHRETCFRWKDRIKTNKMPLLLESSWNSSVRSSLSWSLRKVSNSYGTTMKHSHSLASLLSSHTSSQQHQSSPSSPTSSRLESSFNRCRSTVRERLQRVQKASAHGWQSWNSSQLSPFQSTSQWSSFSATERKIVSWFKSWRTQTWTSQWMNKSGAMRIFWSCWSSLSTLYLLWRWYSPSSSQTCQSTFSLRNSDMNKLRPWQRKKCKSSSCRTATRTTMTCWADSRRIQPISKTNSASPWREENWLLP